MSRKNRNNVQQINIDQWIKIQVQEVKRLEAEARKAEVAEIARLAREARAAEVAEAARIEARKDAVARYGTLLVLSLPIVVGIASIVANYS